MENNKENNQFKISSWAIENPMVIYVLIFACLIIGLFSYYAMPRESFPEIKDTKIYISSIYPGNTAEDVERLITIPIEKAVKSISHISKMTSTSQEDYGMVIIEFDEDIEIETALRKVKDKVDEEVAKQEWPVYNNVKVQPSVFDINFSEEIPIININMEGDYSILDFKRFSKYLKNNIEDVNEVKQVEVRGIQDFEVEIAVNVYKMLARNLSFEDIVRKIKANNVTVSAGNLIVSDRNETIRIVGEASNPEEFQDIVIKVENDAPIYLKDVANISFKEKDAVSYSRSFGNRVVMLDVKKNAGQNMVLAIEKIKEVVVKSKKSYLPSNLKITFSNDQSVQTINQVNDLVNNIIFGVILVVIVLMFFLGIRNAIFVGIAIPLSMVISFMILNSLGYTLNTMVLFALVMGLGMLVDNGVVVVENTYRLMAEQGLSRLEAAKQGIGEIAIPIIISTATTVAAFVPLGFWPGIMGSFMIYFPITLSVVLGSSLFVALLMNSVFVSRFMKVDEEQISKKKLIKISLITIIIGLLGLLIGLLSVFNLCLFLIVVIWLYNYKIIHWSSKFQKVFLGFSEDKYNSFLSYVLMGKRPRKLLLSIIGLFFIAIILLAIAPTKVEFFPENKPKQILIYIEYPQGTSIKKTNRLTKKIEKEVYAFISNDKYLDEKGNNFMVESAIAQVGQGAGNVFVDGASSAEIPNKGLITLLMSDFKLRRGLDSELLRQELQQFLKGNYPGVKISVEKNQDGPPAGYPINIEVRGEGKTYNEILEEAEKIKTFISQKSIAGISQLKVDVNRHLLTNEITVDKKKAGSLGISVSQVAEQLRNALFGVKASTYKYQGDNYDINIRLDEGSRYNENDLFNQRIVFRNEKGLLKEIPIISVINQKTTTSFSSIKHRDSKRLITVYSDILAGFNGNEVVNTTKSEIANFEVSHGFTYKFTGQMEEQAKQMSFLSKALFIALLLIMLLLVIQFNSISKPFIIFLAILLSLIGVLFGLVIFRMNFVIIMTMLGVISLAGIVVNNAVVLLDYIQLLINNYRRENVMKKSEIIPLEDLRLIIVEAGRARLRPVLLTAITTVLGLIPLAIGFNIDFTSLLSEYNPKVYIGGDNVIFWGPLAWTVIFGLAFATFLTLIVIPVTYLMITKLKMKSVNRQ